MDIEHISVSRYKVAHLCEAQYKFKYHDKIEMPGEEPFYFTYGKIIHRIAEEFVRERAKRSLGEISTDVQRGKILLEEDTKAPPIPADYKHRMPDHLRSIQKLTKQLGTEGYLEYKFNYDLDPPHEKFATGFIDRLIVKDRKAIIVDYKTTKRGPWRVNRQNVVRDLQLRCYARVVQREFNIAAENILAVLCYVEGGDLIGARFSHESLLQVERDLLSTYNEIAAMNPAYVRGRVGEHCKRCDYQSICPFYRGSAFQSNWDGDLSTIYG